MKQLIDTHTHLYLPEFADSHEAVQRAFDAGLSHMIFPNVDLSTISPMRELAGKFKGRISMAMGLHPTEVKEDWQEALSIVESELADNRADYVAIGEVGIDLYWDKTFASQQMMAFDTQASWAERENLPIIIHCRDGLDQALEVLQGHHTAQAVFHSFSGTAADVDRIRRVGDYYFGINGVCTFKNCHVRDSVAEITLDRLVLETDSPYLAPVPHRGKRNESAYLPLIATHIADHLGISADVVAECTTTAAKRLFKLESVE